jgi:hypothetical protein
VAHDRVARARDVVDDRGDPTSGGPHGAHGLDDVRQELDREVVAPRIEHEEIDAELRRALRGFDE